jgi:acetylornithine deacetylase/succinyl-diaminopimelate desuccinylase-like protein
MSMKIDWNSVGQETGRLLSELIKINTTNPPGNEIDACRYLEGVLSGMGLAPEILESEPGRGSILARVKADDPEGPGLLLLSHLDVVPAEASEWEVDPFSGLIKEGEVWGRGALDCKNVTATEISALKIFLEQGHKPRRDIIIAATADEEEGGEKGVGWLCQKHFEKIKAGFGINEGGGYGYPLRGRELFVCQTAEKAVCWLRLTARGQPGHGAMPPDDSAMNRMIAALTALLNQKEPLRVADSIRALSDKVGREFGKRAGLAFRIILRESIMKRVLPRVARPEQQRIVEAMLHNTLAITSIKGGDKINVIPSGVEATLDCRLIPGYPAEAMRARVQETVDPFNVNVEIVGSSKGSEMGVDSELYRAIEDVLKNLRPDAVMIPYLMPGGTDGRYLVERGMKVYGFIPVVLKDEMRTPGVPGGEVLSRVHGVNERISIKNLEFATRFVYELLVRFCSKNPNV